MADTLVTVPGQEGHAGRVHTSALCTQAALVPHPLPGPRGTPVVFFGSGAAASPEPGPPLPQSNWLPLPLSAPAQPPAQPGSVPFPFMVKPRDGEARGYGAQELAPRRAAPSGPSPVSIRHHLSSLTPPPGQGGDPRAGPKGSTWPGRAGPGKGEQHCGGRDGKGCQSLRSGQASRRAPPPHPRPSTPRLRGGGPGAVNHVPRRASCAQLRPAVRRGPDTRHPAAAPPQTTPLASAAGSRRDGGARETDPAGSACPGTELAPQTSGPGLLPSAGSQTAAEPSAADQDDHRRAARHLRQHAGRVALPACRSLSLRGRQQSQEAGMKVALSPPQGSRTESEARWRVRGAFTLHFIPSTHHSI